MMMSFHIHIKRVSWIFFMLIVGLHAHAQQVQVKGKVLDVDGEPLVGAHIRIMESTKYAIAGLDGTFSFSPLSYGKYTLEASFIGFESSTVELEIIKGKAPEMIRFALKADQKMLGEVLISGSAIKGSENEARLLERNSLNTINVISAKAIELSPDVSVANVVQRVSGLTVERNSNGDPQYAIVRGMDKRYNYTLVNGVKIPSPDNKNRYIPLDIFPASLLERLEVHKSLTPDMEGDAIGGVVNMVMKSAPENREIKIDVQGGYNMINLSQGFNTFDAAAVRPLSPLERFGTNYQAQTADFSTRNLNTENITPIPDVFATFSIGDRFFKNRLGILAAGSIQNSYRGTESIWFDYSIESNNDNLVPNLDKLQERTYSTRQSRNGLHVQLDYKLAPGHTLKWYNGYYALQDEEVRLLTEYRLGGGQTNPATGNADGMSQETRTRLTQQSITTSNLSGQHQLLPTLEMDWSSVFSYADRNRPDNAQFNRVTEMRDFVINPSRVAASNPRRWEKNDDQDWTTYLNFNWKPSSIPLLSLLKFGGMARFKERDNFFNQYNFAPEFRSVEGEDWLEYQDVSWRLINPQGTSTNALNYEASEQILAYYFMSILEFGSLQLTSGARLEHTKQGYAVRAPLQDQISDTAQVYVDVLPSAHFRYRINDRMFWRGGYFYGISRPGFFEIVPYRLLDEDYNERGNPNLRRVRAHNFDLRWEYFTSPTDQILIGAFYKKIIDPIEYALVPFGANNAIVLQPGNFGVANNWGIEADFTKFFNKIGIRANYTFTNSVIESVKSRIVRENPSDPSSELITVNQVEKRPLQGQARHISNISLLYKDLNKGTEAQVAFIYTGERLETVSPFYKNDSWALPILQIDLSVEQRLGQRVFVFLKANNIHNAPYKVIVKSDPNPRYSEYLYQENIEKYTLIRRDQYLQSFRVGFRCSI